MACRFKEQIAMTVADIYGLCKRCGEAITKEADLRTFRKEPYHKDCYPTEEEIEKMDNSYTFTLPTKRKA